VSRWTAISDGLGLRNIWSFLASIVLWAAGAWLAPGLDPEPRATWHYRADAYERPWCPPCALVEDHVDENLGLVVLVLMLLVFAAMCANAGALAADWVDSIRGRRGRISTDQDAAARRTTRRARGRTGRGRRPARSR
jgi:hypothetical protein